MRTPFAFSFVAIPALALLVGCGGGVDPDCVPSATEVTWLDPSGQALPDRSQQEAHFVGVEQTWRAALRSTPSCGQGADATVVVFVADRDGAELLTHKEVSSQRVDDALESQVTFRFTPPIPGRYRLAVAHPPAASAAEQLAQSERFIEVFQPNAEVRAPVTTIAEAACDEVHATTSGLWSCDTRIYRDNLLVSTLNGRLTTANDTLWEATNASIERRMDLGTDAPDLAGSISVDLGGSQIQQLVATEEELLIATSAALHHVSGDGVTLTGHHMTSFASGFEATAVVWSGDRALVLGRAANGLELCGFALSREAAPAPLGTSCQPFEGTFVASDADGFWIGRAGTVATSSGGTASRIVTLQRLEPSGDAFEPKPPVELPKNFFVEGHRDTAPWIRNELTGAQLVAQVIEGALVFEEFRTPGVVLGGKAGPFLIGSEAGTGTTQVYAP